MDTLPPSAIIQEVSHWTPETLLDLQLITEIKISPDNSTALVVQKHAKITEDTSAFLTRIYKTRPGQDPLPFTDADSSASQPSWSPDGKWVAFISDRSKKKHLYLIPSDGGEARQLTQGEKNVLNYSWSPDGKKIAYVMSEKKGNLPPETSKAYVYKKAKEVNRLWVLDPFSGEKPIALTPDEYHIRPCEFPAVSPQFDWSPDAEQIIFAHSPTDGIDDYYLNSSIAKVNLSSGEITDWEKHARCEANPRYSPDGQSIAYLQCSDKEKYVRNMQVALRNVDGGQPTLLESPPDAGPYTDFLGWASDGKGLYFFEPKGTKNLIVMVPVDGGQPKELDTNGIFFTAPSLSPDKTMLGLVVQSPSDPPEAYWSQLDAFDPIPLSSFNEKLSALPKIKTEVISWQSDDFEIDGLLTYPLHYEEGRQYPLLVEVHGGPMGVYSENFLGNIHFYPFPAFAEAGFMILRPNFRGSSGYGKDFRIANYNDWGGKDLDDILTGIDTLIEKNMVDSERIGIMGASYGGFMTAWAVSQTDRFKAASMAAGLYNLVSFTGTTDIPEYLPDYFGLFHLNPKLYQNRSPIYHVQNITTPCLIEHGTADKRVPISQAYEMYHALQYAGQDATLIVYPDVGHGTTDPKMKIDALKSNLAWFQEHLMDEESSN